jgi:rhodanese-related sulfurtransferase
MSAGQIVLLLIAGLALFLVVRRFMTQRSMAHYTSAEVEAKVKGGERVVLLDVRTQGERDRGSIKGSLHIPLHQLRGRMEELQRHRDKEIICYCAVGGRSVTAAGMLVKGGLRAANMREGIAGWNRLQAQL